MLCDRNRSILAINKFRKRQHLATEAKVIRLTVGEGYIVAKSPGVDEGVTVCPAVFGIKAYVG